MSRNLLRVEHIVGEKFIYETDIEFSYSLILKV